LHLTQTHRFDQDATTESDFKTRLTHLLGSERTSFFFFNEQPVNHKDKGALSFAGLDGAGRDWKETQTNISTELLV
jgi:hypothetical protein